jgi:hypothetical protein
MPGCAADWIGTLLPYTTGRLQENDQKAIALLLKCGSTQSTDLKSWILGEPSISADFLQSLTGREDRRPQSVLPFPYDTFAALHLQVLAATARDEYAGISRTPHSLGRSGDRCKAPKH